MQENTPTLQVAGHTIASLSPRARILQPVLNGENDVAGQVNPTEQPTTVPSEEQSESGSEADGDELSEDDTSSSVSDENEARAHTPTPLTEPKDSRYEYPVSEPRLCDERLRGLRTRGYECLDHTGDVTIHSKGKTLKKAIARAALCLFDIMCDVSKVDCRITHKVSAEGHDRESLLVNFLNELVALYGTHYFIGSRVRIVQLDEKNFTIEAEIEGENFDASKHTSGTEVKAATLHEAAIWEKKIVPGESFCINYDMEDESDCCYEIFVVLDV